MEAKADVRKLQLLNDRIIQTLEALNQVRASVHGIGHTSPYAQYGQPFPQQSPMYPQTMQSTWAAGIGHSPAYGSPYASYSPLASYLGPIGLAHSPQPHSVASLLQNPIGAPWQSREPWASYPFSPPPLAPMGLSHTPFEDVERRIAEQRASDVYRVMQTFPFGAYV